MKRIDYIRAMTAEEMAEKIIKKNITEDFCKSDCENENDCTHDKECCIRWLYEEDPSFARVVWKDR